MLCKVRWIAATSTAITAVAILCGGMLSCGRSKVVDRQAARVASAALRTVKIYGPDGQLVITERMLASADLRRGAEEIGEAISRLVAENPKVASLTPEQATAALKAAANKTSIWNRGFEFEWQGDKIKIAFEVASGKKLAAEFSPVEALKAAGAAGASGLAFWKSTSGDDAKKISPSPAPVSK